MRSNALPRLALALLLLSLAGPAGADWRQWLGSADYDPAITDPATHLDRGFADRPLEVDEVFAYVQRLARESDRVRIETMGHSVQGDPLFLLSITDPANRSSLDQRSRHLEVVRDPWTHDAAARRASSAALLPATWIACSVHGDEASGTDAGVFLAYHLAADRSATTREVLSRSVVLIGPSHNPDGRRRFLQHVRTFGRQKLDPDPSPWAAEHWQNWPGGRTNHFLFDLNRDWAFLTQQETRSHVSTFLRWRPQVFVDLHEMGRETSYYFPPPAQPINPNVEAAQLEWFERFGKANAEAFDARGFDYFVREDFDLFYPGYGDSWPTLQGAIGMTFEQATTRGRMMRQRGGRVVGYAEAVEHHAVAAWTTLLTVAGRGEELLTTYREFFESARRRAERDPRKEIVLSVATHGAEASRLAEVLVRQGIEVWRTERDARVRLAPYDGGTPRVVELPAGSFRIPMEQAAHALVRSLLDAHTPMDEDFLAQETRRRERGQSNRFYDVTAWSLVYSHGAEAYSSPRRLEVPSRRLGVEEAERGLFARREIEGGSRLGWILPYRDNGAIEALRRLWADGIEVECLLEPTTHGGRRFERGALLVKRERNRGIGDLDARMARLAREAPIDVHAVDASWTGGGASLGSSRAVPLRRPRIGVLIGPGVSPASAGGLTWLLEDRYGIEFTGLMLESIDKVDLREFDAILVPELREPDRLPLTVFDHWVRAGGVLVTVGKAVTALTGEESDWTSVRRVEDLAQLTDPAGRLGDFELGRAVEDEEGAGPLPPERKPLPTPGAIVRLQLDPVHYLTLGEGGSCFAPLLSDRVLTPSVDGANVARVDASAPRGAGFMWPVMEEALKGKAYVVEERRDRGRVVLFAEDPGFRGTWEGMHRLLLNGLLLGPSVISSES